MQLTNIKKDQKDKIFVCMNQDKLISFVNFKFCNTIELFYVHNKQLTCEGG